MRQLHPEVGLELRQVEIAGYGRSERWRRNVDCLYRRTRSGSGEPDHNSERVQTSRDNWRHSSDEGKNSQGNRNPQSRDEIKARTMETGESSPSPGSNSRASRMCSCNRQENLLRGSSAFSQSSRATMPRNRHQTRP